MSQPRCESSPDLVIVDRCSSCSRSFLSQPFFDPSSYHSLILSFAFGFGHHFQSLDQFWRQPDSTWAVVPRMGHWSIEVLRFHPVILRLNLLPLRLGQPAKSLLHLFLFFLGLSSQPVKTRASRILYPGKQVASVCRDLCDHPEYKRHQTARHYRNHSREKKHTVLTQMLNVPILLVLRKTSSPLSLRHGQERQGLR